MGWIERYRQLSWEKVPGSRTIATALLRAALPAAEWALRFRTMPGDSLASRWAQVARVHERETAWWVRRLLARGGTFVDAGANVGYYSVLAARSIRGPGRIFAVEPNPDVRPILDANCRRFPAITVCGVALGAVEATASLHVNSIESSTGTLHDAFLRTREDGLRRMGLSGERRRHEVRVRRGDDLLREEGVAQIDLLKVDVEGAELDVLEGLHDTLKRSRDAAILIELNPASVTAAGCDPVGVWSSLRQLGFDVHDVNDRALDSPQFDAWPPLASHGYRNLIAVRRRPRSED